MRRLCRFGALLLAPKIHTPFRSLSVFLLAGATALSAADNTRIKFDLPAGEAAQTLKTFAQQAQREIIFSTKSVEGIKTNPVQGELTVREALAALLAGTKLTVFEDEKTGSLAI
jgi:iron complex outermembrane receptor protein